jgi:3-keto-disaccharide hydrolase
MKPTSLIHHKRLFVTALTLAILTAVRFIAPAAEDTDDWKPLLDGNDLSAWKVPEPNPFWKVVDGVLVGESNPEKKGSMLWTKKSYHDFVIECEARWSGEIDSGIMLRKPELQMQMGVSRSLKKDMTCSFYTGGKEKYPESGQAKNLEKLFKTDDWNKYRLEAKGDTFTVWLNGERIVKYVDPKYAEAAPIGLQIHPGLKMKVEFRNIRLRSLD